MGITAYVSLNDQAETRSGSVIANTLHNVIIPGLHNNLSYDNAELVNQLVTLQKLCDTIEQEEQRVYELFSVKDIEELNQRIQVDMQPLLAFNNRALQKSLQLLDQSVGVGYYLEQLQPLMEHTLEEHIQQNLNNTTDQEILEAIRLKAIEIINESLSDSTQQFQHTRKNRSLGGLLSNFIIKEGKLALKDTINQSKFRSDVKSRLDQFLNSKENAQFKANYTDTSASVDILVTQKNQEAYAGWGLSYNSIKNDPEHIAELRYKILQQCQNLINDAKCNIAFARAFAQFPDEGLFKNSVTGVMGALGEIQLGAIINMLLDGKTAVQLQTGALRNELSKNETNFGSGKQLSVDFVLEGVGFQVKNYNEYANVLGLKQLEGQAHFTLGLSNSIDAINNKLGLDQELTDIIKLFFGIKSFNTKYENPDEMDLETLDNYDSVVHMIDVLNNEISNLYALFPDRILRLSQEIAVMNQDVSVLKGNYFKTFFFSNGVFIPASRLLKAIIQLFDDLRRGNLKEFVLQSSYSGPTAEFYKDNPELAPLYESIAQNVNLKLNYIFYLNDYLNIN